MVKQLIKAIRDSGLSFAELSRLTGVSQPQLSRFANGSRTLTLPAVANLCDALNLVLVQKKPSKPKASSSRRAKKEK